MRGLPKSIIKKYGITKKAWSVYRGGKVKVAKKGRRTRARAVAKRVYHRARTGFSMSGLGGIKGIIAGTAGLILMQRYNPFGGIYKPAVDKVAIGVIAPMVGLDNRDMLTVGIKEGVATLVNSYLGGTLFGQAQEGGAYL